MATQRRRARHHPGATTSDNIPPMRFRFVLASAVGLFLAVAVPAAEERPAKTAPSVSNLPATGQVETFPARPVAGGSPVAVADDGAVRAGRPLRYRDNGDGTISDLNTGLMWEKKCRGCGGLHDDGLLVRWSGYGRVMTLWDWLDAVNAEGGTGFAGHADWRVPNAKELVSIVDYGRSDPAIDPAFAGSACEDECRDLADPACSCTVPEKYWTSTTFSDFPAHAIVVDFGSGFVEDRIKTLRLRARAVRSER